MKTLKLKLLDMKGENPIMMEPEVKTKLRRMLLRAERHIILNKPEAAAQELEKAIKWLRR